MGWWARLFGREGKRSRERTPTASWQRGPCWKLSPLDNLVPFLRALPTLFPEGCVLYLEDGRRPRDVREFLEARTAPDARRIAPGTLLPRPTVYRMPLTRENVDGLAALAEHHAFPELACHVHVYSGERVLLLWYDACADPIYVAREVPEERVRAFCAEVGIPYEEVKDW